MTFPRGYWLTSGGSHVAVDAVGSEETCADSILSLRRRGRHVQVGLLPRSPASTRGSRWLALSAGSSTC